MGFRFLALGVLAAAACSVPDLDLEGRSCPCIEGYTCVAEICVRDGVDGGVTDANRDAPSVDAPSVDAPPVDAPRADAPVDAPGDLDVPGVDVGPADTGTDAPPAARDTACDLLAVNPDVVFCDGFEDGLDAWTLDSDTIERVTMGTYRGAGAAEIRPMDGLERPVALSARVFDDPSERDHWLRMYVRVDIDATSAVEIMDLTGPSISFPVYVDGTGYSNIHAHGFAGDTGWDSTFAFPIDEWTCVEIHARYSGGAESGRAELFINGVRAARGDDIEFLARADSIRVGAVFADPVTERTHRILVDEVVASRDQIGCD